MKLMTVKINNNIDHILNFDHKHQSAKSYLLECGNSTTFNLLTFNLANQQENPIPIVLQDDRQKSIYIDVIDYKFLATDDSTGILQHSLKISLSDTKKSKLNLKNLSPVFFNKGILSINNMDLLRAHAINVTFAYAGYESYLKLYFAPQNNIYQAVLDFGSESSQVILTKGKNVRISDALTLFSEMKMGLDAREEKETFASHKNEEFMQYDGDSDKFYRSLFLAKCHDIDRNKLKSYLPLEDNEICKLLSFRKDREKLLAHTEEKQASYIVLPNAKLTSFGGVDLPEIDGESVDQFHDRYFYRAAINSFITLILDKVSSIRECHANPSPRFISFKVLMPNVYRQETVSQNLNDLYEDISNMITDPQARYSNIGGFDIMSISESDASFIGYMNLQGVKLEDGYYLILDAGKGTIDFSIIKYSQHDGLYKSIYRSGIIGAGNAITYAFLLSFLKEGLRIKYNVEKDETEETALRRFIFENILKGDLAYQYKLVSILEQYKKNYSDGKLSGTVPNQSADVTNKSSLKGTSLENFVTWLQTVDYKINIDYVESIIDEIVGATMSKFPKRLPSEEHINIKKVLFTGRAFLFEPLKEAVKTALYDRFNKTNTINEMEYREITGRTKAEVMKMVCLFPFMSGKYDGRLVGVPFVNEMPEKTNNKDKNSSIFSALLSKIPGKHKREELEENINHFTSCFNTRSNIKYGSASITKGSSQELKPLVYGFEETFDPQTRLNVGSTEYIYESSHQKSFKVKIFFDGYEFIVRDGRSFLPAPMTFGIEGGHVFASQFPYVSIDKLSDIYVPEIRKTVGSVQDLPDTKTVQSADQPNNEEKKSSAKIADFTKRK